MLKSGGRITYEPGDLVTVTPADDDPWILHMQRHVVVKSQVGDGILVVGYMVELDSTTPDNAIQGPLAVYQLAPGWVEQDGRVRVDVDGKRPIPAQPRAADR